MKRRLLRAIAAVEAIGLVFVLGLLTVAGIAFGTEDCTDDMFTCIWDDRGLLALVVAWPTLGLLVIAGWLWGMWVLAGRPGRRRWALALACVPLPLLAALFSN